MKAIKIIALFIILSLIFTSCGEKNILEVVSRSKSEILNIDHTVATMSASPNIESYKLITDGDRVAFYCDLEKNCIAVLDKVNGYLWENAVNDKKFDKDKMNMIWVRYMKSLVSIRVNNAQNSEIEITRASNTDRNVTTQITEKNGKILINFNFTVFDISFSMEMYLKNDKLVVSIPDDKTVEGKKYQLVSIEPLPFLGYMDDNATGYTLIPDGSGAVIENKPNLGKSDFESHTLSVYAMHEFESDKFEDSVNNEKFNLSLPLFGVKMSENALLAQITSGAQNSELTVSPSGNIVSFFRSAFKFIYRNTFNLPTTNLSSDTGEAIAGGNPLKVVTKIDKARIKNNVVLNYSFLRGKIANYAGMANVYQNYLIENKLINKTIQKQMPLMLDVLCNIEKKQLIGTKNIEMTSVKDIIVIEKTLSKSGIENVDISLLGFNKGGYTNFVSVYSPKTDIDKLLKGNNRYYLDLSPFSTNEKNPNRNNLLILKNKSPATYENGKIHYYTPEAMSELIGKIADKSGDFGLKINQVGRYLYVNGNKLNGIEQIVESIGSKAKNNRLILEMPNEYALLVADFVTNVPTKSSRYDFYDYDVPFYQIVLHGLVPYTQGAINLSYDTEIAKLMLIETGAVPYFEITKLDAINLKDTEYKTLFSSNFNRWKGEIIEITNQLRNELSEVWNSKIINHTRISDGEVMVEYENGYQIYVNYNTKSYRVVKK